MIKGKIIILYLLILKKIEKINLLQIILKYFKYDNLALKKFQKLTIQS